jgi:hypothetical protein
MMARGPNGAKGVLLRPVKDSRDRVANGTCGMQGDLIRPLADDRIGLDITSVIPRELFNLTNVVCRVDRLDLLSSRRTDRLGQAFL